MVRENAVPSRQPFRSARKPCCDKYECTALILVCVIFATEGAGDAGIELHSTSAKNPPRNILSALRADSARGVTLSTRPFWRRLRGGSGDGAANMKLKAVSCPDKSLALTNHVYLNPADLKTLLATVTQPGTPPTNNFHATVGTCVYVLRPVECVGEGCVALNSVQRKSIQVSCDDVVEVRPYDLPDSGIQIASVELAVDLAGRASGKGDPVDAEALAKNLLLRFVGQVLCEGQLLVIDFCGLNLQLKVQHISTFKATGPSQVLSEDQCKDAWGQGGSPSRFTSIFPQPRAYSHLGARWPAALTRAARNRHTLLASSTQL